MNRFRLYNLKQLLFDIILLIFSATVWACLIKVIYNAMKGT